MTRQLTIESENSDSQENRVSFSRFSYHLSHFTILAGLVILLFMMLFPLGMIIINSFKTETEYYANGPFALPETANLEILQAVWEQTDYTTKLRNSLIISSTTAVIGVTISLLNAYALGIGKIPGKSFFLLFFLLAITLPQESMMYPLYYMFRQVGLYNTIWGVIIITAVFHSAFGTYLLTSVLSSFNKDLLEAAMIDGANRFQLLLRIVIPLSWSSISVLLVLFFVWTWNDFFLPLVFLISNDNQTVPVAMALARGERGMVITSQSAAAFLGILPAFIIFMLFQRTLTRGITAGAIK